MHRMKNMEELEALVAKWEKLAFEYRVKVDDYKLLADKAQAKLIRMRKLLETLLEATYDEE